MPRLYRRSSADCLWWRRSNAPSVRLYPLPIAYGGDGAMPRLYRRSSSVAEGRGKIIVFALSCKCLAR